MRKQKPRKLRLTKETLRNLSDREMKKAAGGKKATAGGKPAKAASTENAAPAKAAAKKKTPKAK